MDAFFVVPALVSPNINENIIPALTKTIERNIILTNYASFRLALLQKYKGPFSTVMSEGVNQKSYSVKSNTLNKIGKQLAGVESADDLKNLVTNNIGDVASTASKVFGDVRPNEGDITKWKHNTVSKDAVELPKGITFYNTIGLEPTYLSLPLSMKSGLFGLNSAERLMMVAVKCVPYKMTNVKDVLELAKSMRGRSEVERWFKKKWNTLKTKIPFTIPHDIRSNGVRGGKTSSVFHSGGQEYDPLLDLIYSPNSDILANPKKLAKLMSVRGRTNWSTLTIFSNYDFDKSDMADTLDSYQMLVKAGWGDTVIVNEIKESAYFCTTKMSACYMMPFSVMKNIMNLDNVIDYSDVSRITKPFSITPIRRALTEKEVIGDGKNVLQEMDSIVSPDTSEVDAVSRISDRRDYTAPISFPTDLDPSKFTKPVKDLSGKDTGTYVSPDTNDEVSYFSNSENIIKK